MQRAQTGPKPGESSWLWLFKILSGLLIIAILVIHFLVNHFISSEALLSFDEVLEYYRNPIIPIMEGFFLVFVVSHSLIGMRSIFLDLNPSKTVMQVLDVVLIAIGSVSIVYGIWLLFAVVAQIPA